MQKGVADALRTAAKAISQARALVITAGAGLGVDSGLPDFRGKEGFWKAYPHFEKLGYSFVQMANPAWFENDPQLAWGFYGHRLKLYKDTQPHEGYHLLRKWANACEKGGFVVTSNVDGHFAKAGFDIDRLYEVHGSINYVQCTAPHRCAGGTAIMPSPPPSELEVNMDTLRVQAESVPKCPQAGCGKVQRPAILLFNDYHWASDHFDEQEARYGAYIDGLDVKDGELVVIEMGAGTSVPTIRMESEAMCEWRGAFLVRINPRESDVPSKLNGRAVGIPLGARDALTQIEKIMSEKRTE